MKFLYLDQNHCAVGAIGAKNLLKAFYEYIDMTGLKPEEKKKSTIEDENLKLVGFVRLCKLSDIKKED